MITLVESARAWFQAQAPRFDPVLRERATLNNDQLKTVDLISKLVKTRIGDWQRNTHTEYDGDLLRITYTCQQDGVELMVCRTMGDMLNRRIGQYNLGIKSGGQEKPTWIPLETTASRLFHNLEDHHRPDLNRTIFSFKLPFNRGLTLERR
jgi:hypothetical protein